MSLTNTNDILTGRVPTVYPSGSEVVVQSAGVAVLAADLTLNNFGAVGILPAGCIPTNLYVDADDLDSNVTPTLTVDVGLLNAAGTAFDTTFATGLTVGQAAGVVSVLSSAMLRLAESTSDRKLGVKFSAAPATAQAGSLYLHLHYRAA